MPKYSTQDQGLINMSKVLEGSSDKTQKDEKNERINALLREAYDTEEPTAPRYFYAQKLRQAVWKTMGRTQAHDFSMHASPEYKDDGTVQILDDEYELFVTEGFSTVLEKAKDAETFAGKNGIMFNAYLYGNGYRMIGKRGHGKFPVEFIPITNGNLYMSRRSTGLRRGNKPTTRACAVFSGTQEEFNALFPDFASERPMGKIPKKNYQYKENDMTWEQALDEEDVVEWAYYWQIDGEEPMFRLVAGAELKVLEAKDGDEYPYSFKNDELYEELYIPVSDYICDPVAEGAYCEGLGSILYRLSVMGRQLANLMFGNVRDNTFPHTIIEGIPADQIGPFMQMVDMADQLAASGKRGYIPLPASPMSSTGMRTNALLNPGGIDGAMALSQFIDNEIKRDGVNLDEFEGEDPTEMQIRAYDENATAFVRQVGEYNAEQRKFELYVVLDLLKKTISKNDKTPLNIKTSVGTAQIKGGTLGMLVQELKKYHFFFQVNARSTAVPSNLMRRTQLNQTLEKLPQGTPEFNAVARQLAAFDGVELPAPSEQVPPETQQPQPQIP